MANIQVQFQEASQRRMTVKQILAPCSLAPHLLLQGGSTARPSYAFLPKHPHSVPVAFGAGKATAWKLTVSCPGNTTLSKGSSLEWQIKIKKHQDNTQLKGNFAFYQPGLETSDLHLCFLNYITLTMRYTLTPAFTQHDQSPWREYRHVSCKQVLFLTAPGHQRWRRFLTLGST